MILLHFPASSESPHPLLDGNYVQVDGFLLDEQLTSADKQEYSGSTTQIFTARPALSFYFNFDSNVLRPKIVLNPFNSSTEGSLSFGRLFKKRFEFGLYSLLNRDQKILGAAGQQNETTQTDFLLGPYAVIYPYFAEGYFLECQFIASYVYQNQQTTVFGANDLISDKKGFQLSGDFFYHYQMSQRVYFSPNVNVIYKITSDLGGANTVRNQFDIQILPVSLRISL